MDKKHRPPVALTIAGSDSGGGAGIQADLKTFHALGVYGASVITALTAQNTQGVKSVHPASAQSVEAQLDAVLDDLKIGSIKTGMLVGPEIIEAVADRLSRHREPLLVIDPVMISTSGRELLSAVGCEKMIQKLFPLAKIITPNLPEAERILGRLITSAEEMAAAARELLKTGAQSVLLKGGHMAVGDPGGQNEIVDYWTDGNIEKEYRSPRIQVFESGKKNDVKTGTASVGSHGTGCVLSAALAAEFAKGVELDTAIRSARRFVAKGIRNRLYPGQGQAVTNTGLT